MKYASPKAGWPGFSGRTGQRGQALVYGMFMIVASLAALFFLFNTGQLSQEKTKLVNTADAVAYSVGVMDARTLNFMAYTNRAMLANTVAIAQLVSLSSWASYVDRLSDWGELIDWDSYNVPVPLEPSWEIVDEIGSDLNDNLNGNNAPLKTLAEKSDSWFIRKILTNAQLLAYGGLIAARPTVMKEVADANYRADGTVVASGLGTSDVNFSEFVDTYSGDKRTRFAEVAVAAAKSDGFVKHRSWFSTKESEMCEAPYMDWISRRGGTELIGYDEWKAMDVLSEYKWFPDYEDACSPGERPSGWGATVAADNAASDSLTDFDRYDGARKPIIGAIKAAFNADFSSLSWAYGGLPKYYELSKKFLDKKDEKELVLRYAVSVKRKIAETRTSEGGALVRNSGDNNRLAKALNNYQAAPAEDKAMVAASAVESYFDRGSDNPYGKKIGNGKPREIASLFNPFWHVHLVPVKVSEREAAAPGAAILP